MRDLYQDLRYGIRMLRGRPGFTAVAVLTLAAARLVSGAPFKVRAADPAMFVAAALLLSGVALLASYLPAWRAPNVDPMEALRHG